MIDGLRIRDMMASKRHLEIERRMMSDQTTGTTARALAARYVGHAARCPKRIRQMTAEEAREHMDSHQRKVDAARHVIDTSSPEINGAALRLMDLGYSPWSE